MVAVDVLKRDLTTGRMVIIGLMVVSAVLDLVTTHIGFGLGLREANLVPNLLLSAAGEYGLVLLKVVAVSTCVGLVLLLHRRYPRLWRGLALASAITLLVVALNILSIVLAVA